MPVLTERFFLNIAVAWSPESPSATPAETCIVRRDCLVFERFSTSTDSHFADEKSAPASDVHLSPVPHSALGNLTRTQFAPSRSTHALWTPWNSSSDGAAPYAQDARQNNANAVFIT